ncbi:topoisomerase C-terminal repeat-containing protein, partial [Enterococcus faecium]|uniref:topoisomerase C-terminal repeat-containing protein n=1 Tax=Enterococcus faecium TaxID=1352 RepID=UPI00032E9238
LLGMFLSLKTLYRKRTVIWPFYFYTIIRTLSKTVKELLENGKTKEKVTGFISKDNKKYSAYLVFDNKNKVIKKEF